MWTLWSVDNFCSSNLSIFPRSVNKHDCLAIAIKTLDDIDEIIIPTFLDPRLPMLPEARSSLKGGLRWHCGPQTGGSPTPFQNNDTEEPANRFVSPVEQM